MKYILNKPSLSDLEKKYIVDDQTWIELAQQMEDSENSEDNVSNVGDKKTEQDEEEKKVEDPPSTDSDDSSSDDIPHIKSKFLYSKIYSTNELNKQLV